MNLYWCFSLAILFLTSITSQANTISSNLPSVKGLPLQTAIQMDGKGKPVAAAPAGFQIPQALKLLIGAGGIYSAFLYYGTLQEDVFHYKAADGTKFSQAWFLQALGKIPFVILSINLSSVLTLSLCRGFGQRYSGWSWSFVDWRNKEFTIECVCTFW